MAVAAVVDDVQRPEIFAPGPRAVRAVSAP